MIAILFAVLLAAVAYWMCVLLGLPVIVGIVAAIVVLLACAGGAARRGGRPGSGL
jgi:hypothetical protein